MWIPKALDLFLKSSRLNPDNYLVYWNIARIGCILDLRDQKIISNYEKALNLVQNKNKKIIEQELNKIRNDMKLLIPKEPIISI